MLIWRRMSSLFEQRMDTQLATAIAIVRAILDVWNYMSV